LPTKHVEKLEPPFPLRVPQRLVPDALEIRDVFRNSRHARAIACSGGGRNTPTQRRGSYHAMGQPDGMIPLSPLP
jgi:hypothetical protein